MTGERKKKLVHYALAILVGAALSVQHVSQQDFFSQALVDQYRILCDAFTIPGILMVLFAGLLSLSGEGALDGVGYCLSQAAKILTFRGTNTEKYADYLERRRGKRAKGFGFLYVVGIAFLAVAVVFLVLFQSVRQ